MIYFSVYGPGYILEIKISIASRVSMLVTVRSIAIEGRVPQIISKSSKDREVDLFNNNQLKFVLQNLAAPVISLR